MPRDGRAIEALVQGLEVRPDQRHRGGGDRNRTGVQGFAGTPADAYEQELLVTASRLTPPDTGERLRPRDGRAMLLMHAPSVPRARSRWRHRLMTAVSLTVFGVVAFAERWSVLFEQLDSSSDVLCCPTRSEDLVRHVHMLLLVSSVPESSRRALEGFDEPAES